MLEDLLDACRRTDLERVRTLVTADPTLLTRQAATGETPLLRGGSLETADLLLSHRAAPRRIARNVMSNTPLHAALADRWLSAGQLKPRALGQVAVL
jgi:hypothetical protein